MNIKEFAAKMQSTVAAALNKEVNIEEKLKLNGIRRYALMVTETDNDLSPNIYLEPFFEIFQINNSTEIVTEKIISAYRNNSLKESVSMKWLEDFSQVRDKVFCLLVNYEANRELLEQIPHTRYLDFAKIFGVQCEMDGIIRGSIILYKNHLDMWGITAEELIPLAEENTPKICPVRISNMSDCIPGNDNPLSAESWNNPPDLLSRMYVLTNLYNAYGAAAICYKSVLKGFSELMGKDILILPESIHHTILIPLIEDEDIESHREMFHDIQQNHPCPSKFLSANIYLYRKDTLKIEIV